MCVIVENIIALGSFMKRRVASNDVKVVKRLREARSCLTDTGRSLLKYQFSGQ